jgi:hypothetical protein
MKKIYFYIFLFPFLSAKSKYIILSMLSSSRLTKLKKKGTFLDSIVEFVKDILVGLFLFRVRAAHSLVEYRYSVYQNGSIK